MTVPDPTELIVRTIVCPSCQQLPETAIGPTQAICATDDCPGMIFNFLREAADQLADANVLDLTGGRSPQTAALKPMPVDAPVLDQRRDDPDWCHHAATVRAQLHQWGCRCAEGCPSCDPELTLNAGQSGDVMRTVAEALALAPASFPATVDTGRIKELLAPIGVLYGVPGLNIARQLILDSYGAR